MAEDALHTAKIEADSCIHPNADSSTARVNPASNSHAGASPIGRETYILLTDTLFKFNNSHAEDMIPGGRQRLNDVLERLKAYKSIQTMTVLGYTDRLGSNDHNDKLSEARTKTVQGYLESVRVKSAASIAKGKGKRDSLAKDCSVDPGRERLIQCLQPDRSVTIEVTALES